jgi:hypothetical protein
VSGLGGRQRFRRRLLVIFLICLIPAYARQLIGSPTAGQDFRAFFAATQVMAQGKSPYDWGALGLTEDRLYNTPSNQHPGDRAYYDFQPYPEGPWLAMGLLPLSGLPWPIAYALFAATMALCILAGAWLCFRRLAFPVRAAAAATCCALLIPVGFLNVFQGQVTPLIFLAFAAAWALASRDRPELAGLTLAAVWVKPNLGLIAPVVLALLFPRAIWRLGLGFVAGSLAAFFAAWLEMGAALLQWPLELVQHWRAVQGLQPDIASVHALYYPASSGPLKVAALTVVMLAGLTYAIWSLRRTADPVRRGLTILLLWIAWLPFVHSYDTLLLLPVLGWLLVPAGEGWRRIGVECAAWAFAILPFAYFLGLRAGYFNGFSAIAVVILLVAWHRAALTRPTTTRELVAA